MREYYKKILQNTYVIFGVNQMEKMDNEQIEMLLDALENVSKLYHYIPQEFQKKIIRARLIKDKDFQNINVRLISRWFEEDGKIFFQQSCHKEIQPDENYKPVEGEERELWLTKWEETLKQAEKNLTSPLVKGTGSKLRERMEEYAPTPTEPIQRKIDTNAVKSFWIDGFEIYAKDEQDAMRIFVENFGQPKDETVNKERTEGTREATGLSDDQNNTPQRNENFETEDKH